MTGVIVVIGGVVIVGVFGTLFYVSTLAKNVYAIKIQMQDQLKREIEKIEDHVDKELAQRQKWIARDAAGVADDKVATLRGEVEDLRRQVTGELAESAEKIKKILALQQALAAKQAKTAPSTDPALEPAFQMKPPPKTASR